MLRRVLSLVFAVGAATGCTVYHHGGPYYDPYTGYYYHGDHYRHAYPYYAYHYPYRHYYYRRY